MLGLGPLDDQGQRRAVDQDAEARVVEELIVRLGAGQTPCLRVYNKCDAYFGRLPAGEDEICVCARTGEGTGALLYAIGRKLGGDLARVSLRIPYDKAALVERLRREANVLDVQYADGGVDVLAVVRPALREVLRPYEVRRDG